MSTPLLTLVQDLKHTIGRELGGKRIATLLSTYAREHEDWRPLALRDPDCYTRNLVELNDDYELLLLYWSAGQRSPIHNHEGQDCWMAVLEGPVQEASFAFPDGHGPLEAGPVKTFDPGQVAYIHDEVGLHEVRTVPGYDAVSLHLYSKPYGECNCYCPDTGAVTRTSLRYYSVRGRRS